VLRGGGSGLDPGSASRKPVIAAAPWGIASIPMVPLMSFHCGPGRLANRRARHNESPTNGTPGQAVLRRRGRSSTPTDRRPSAGPKGSNPLPSSGESHANLLLSIRLILWRGTWCWTGFEDLRGAAHRAVARGRLPQAVPNRWVWRRYAWAEVARAASYTAGAQFLDAPCGAAVKKLRSKIGVINPGCQPVATGITFFLNLPARSRRRPNGNSRRPARIGSASPVYGVRC
jgi:hypothetical protein